MRENCVSAKKHKIFNITINIFRCALSERLWTVPNYRVFQLNRSIIPSQCDNSTEKENELTKFSIMPKIQKKLKTRSIKTKKPSANNKTVENNNSKLRGKWFLLFLLRLCLNLKSKINYPKSAKIHQTFS